MPAQVPIFWGVVGEGPNLIGLYTRIKRNLWLIYMKYRYSVFCRHRYIFLHSVQGVRSAGV